MNYQRKLSRTAITRRVILLLCIAAAVGAIIGGMIGYATGKRAACMEKETGQAYSGMTIKTENGREKQDDSGNKPRGAYETEMRGGRIAADCKDSMRRGT